MDQNSVFFYLAYKTIHSEMVIPFLAEENPSQESYNLLKTDIGFIQDRALLNKDWYGEKSQLELMNEVQRRYIQRAVEGLAIDLNEMKAFAEGKGLEV